MPRPGKRGIRMPKENERSRNGHDGSNGDATEAIRDALKSKELLGAAALSAAGAVAAAKGPGLVRRLTQATEDRGEQEAERLGEKAAEGAKERLGGGALSGVLGGG